MINSPSSSSESELLGSINKSIEMEEIITLTVRGMTCQSCVNSIQNQLGQTPGVKSVEVNLSAETACISYRVTDITKEEVGWNTFASFSFDITGNT